MSENPCIELDRLTKRFGGVLALDEASFEVRRGEVHAVVGENGAGKSTLMKLLAGVHEPDGGNIRLAGQNVRLKSPRAARTHGISIVFQELNLFPHRSVAANIFANRELTHRWGGTHSEAMRRGARRALSDLGADISPDALVGELNIGGRQLVEIARTLEEQAQILILDEPNSALNEAESARLFEIVRRLRARGITILYVSHRLEEVFALADRITVLRNGRYQGTFVTARTTSSEIVAAMIGRRMDTLFPDRAAYSAAGKVTMEARRLEGASGLGPISFSARSGEIIGFAGLEGSGVDELFHTLFGLTPATGGELAIQGSVQRLRSPLAAMRQGLAMVPESRREQGLFMDWSVARNTVLLVLDQLRNRFGLMDGDAVRNVTGRFVQRLSIATDRPDKLVVHLSGGNQQKVLLAKWLATEPSILILNDPTRGVDVGAKWEIYQLCRQLAAEGMTLLLASSEAEELLGLADRILVMSRGQVVEERPACEFTLASLMKAMTGVSAQN